jgi:hypothetical protein
MFSGIRARFAACGTKRYGRYQTSFSWAVMAAIAVGLSGCAATGAPVVGPDPSDPNVRVPRVGYRSTIGSYTSQRPVSPVPWQEQNRRVAPRDSQSEPAQ